MPPDVLQQHFLPQLQHTISRVRAQRTIDHLIAERESVVQHGAPHDSQRALQDIARLRSNACRPASAWLTCLPTSNSLKFSTEEFRTSIRLRLYLSLLHQDTEM